MGWQSVGVKLRALATTTDALVVKVVGVLT